MDGWPHGFFAGAGAGMAAFVLGRGFARDEGVFAGSLLGEREILPAPFLPENSLIHYWKRGFGLFFRAFRHFARRAFFLVSKPDAKTSRTT
jgi:hypothetical protein